MTITPSAPIVAPSRKSAGNKGRQGRLNHLIDLEAERIIPAQ